MFYIVLLICIAVFFRIQAHYAVHAFTQDVFHRWNNLNNLTRTSMPMAGKLEVARVSAQILWKATYSGAIQTMNNSVRAIGKNTYEVTYSIRGRLYKIVVQTKPGPDSVLQVINDQDEDVTDLVRPYLGPECDWHGNHGFSPTFFGHKELTFNMDDGSVVTYDQNGRVENE